MRTYRTFSEIEESYFQEHPEEIDDYLTLAFEEYAKDGDTKALLASLRVLSRIKGTTEIARKTETSQKELQKSVFEEGNPAFASINSMMHTLGYCLIPQRLHES